jgi:hypothetical protein
MQAPEPGKLRAELLDAAVDLMGRSGRGGAVRVRGDSMRPTLLAGQRLAVEFAPQRLACGDLLLFRQADYLVVHRLLGRARTPSGRPCLRTRGDGVASLDPPVEPQRVVGRVLAVEHRDGWRSVRGAAARAYARCLAVHDLFWAAAGVVARLGDRALRRMRLPAVLLPVVAALDRWLLARWHGLLFCRVHTAVSEPEEARVCRQTGRP